MLPHGFQLQEQGAERKITLQFVVVAQSLNHFQLFATAQTVCGAFLMACQVSLASTVSQSLLKFTSIALVMPPNHLILYRLLLLPSIFPSFRVFSNGSALCIRWPKYWSFSFSISPSSEYSQLISFWIDWINLLAVQGTLKSLFQHLSSIKPKQFLQSLLQLEKCVYPLTFGNSPFPKLVNL